MRLLADKRKTRYGFVGLTQRQYLVDFGNLQHTCGIAVHGGYVVSLAVALRCGLYLTVAKHAVSVGIVIVHVKQVNGIVVIYHHNIKALEIVGAPYFHSFAAYSTRYRLFDIAHVLHVRVSAEAAQVGGVRSEFIGEHAPFLAIATAVKHTQVEVDVRGSSLLLFQKVRSLA